MKVTAFITLALACAMYARAKPGPLKVYVLAGTGLKAVVVQLGNDYPYMRY